METAVMLSATSTHDLLERFRQGDQRAFTLLFEKYRRRLAVLIHYKLGPELRGSLEVDDILQEVFFTASRDLTSFSYRGPGSFLRWLSQIAANAVGDAARYQGRQKRHGIHARFRSASNPLGPEPAVSRTPSRIFAGNERMRQLLDDLEKLPDDYRQVILLARIEGLSTEEIAARMNRPRENVSLLLHRALKRLREITSQR
jgi:RNA polymerase sigma-70 factor (ECF subfamily)